MNSDIILQDSILTTKQKELYTYISNFKHKLNPCDLRDQVTTTTNNELKGGSSENTVVYGVFNVNTSKVVLKMVFNDKGDNRKDNDEDLLYNVTNNLILRNNTPHLIFKYGSLRCENFEAPPKLKELMDSLNKNTKLLTTIVLESGYNGNPTKTLFETFKSQLTPLSKMQIMFQIMWTLECFNKIGFQHNDLHSQNILVSTLKTPKIFTYKYNNILFQLKTKYVVKIFDFDRSTKRPTKIDKTKIDVQVLDKFRLCAWYGQCNKFTKKFDLFTVMRNVIAFKDMKDWVLKFTTMKTILIKTVHPGLLCEEVFDDGCKLIELDDDQLKPVSYILENGFKQFIVENPSNVKGVIYTLPK